MVLPKPANLIPARPLLPGQHFSQPDTSVYGSSTRRRVLGLQRHAEPGMQWPSCGRKVTGFQVMVIMAGPSPQVSQGPFFRPLLDVVSELHTQRILAFLFLKFVLSFRGTEQIKGFLEAFMLDFVERNAVSLTITGTD